MNKNNLVLNTPAKEWRDAWPTGNGEVGALVLGSATHDKIIFNHERLWLYGKELELPDVSKSLDHVRELVTQKKFNKAHNYHRDVLYKEGYRPEMASFSPVSTLELINTDKKSISDYSRSLNMETGEVQVQWAQGSDKYSKKIFSSRKSGNVHFSINTCGDSLLNFDLLLTPLSGNPDIEYLNSHNLKFETFTSDDYLTIKGSEENTNSFGTILLVKAVNGSKRVENSILKIRNAESIELEIIIYVGDDSPNIKSSKSVTSYDKELLNHTKIHGELYNRLRLNLSNPQLKNVQTMFDYGRYLLISSSGKSLPPNLQGLWNGDKLPIWNCFYMLNENVQMMHWQILPGNAPELMTSLFDYYESYINDYKENAQKLFGCRGIFIPANTVPKTGLITDLQGHLIYWTGGAAWLCRLYFDYYLYTEDLDFLENRAIPIMEESAYFYKDFIYKNKDNIYEFCPSISPENSPEDFNKNYKMDAESNITVNATMDIALCKELLTNLNKAYIACGLENKECNIWNEIVDNLPQYKVNSDGAISEWIHDDFSDNYHHRHESHIYPFFPGNEIYKNDKLVSAIETAIDKRLVLGIKEQTGWSVVHLANIYARLGRGNRALECLDILNKYCTGENLFTYHNDWRDSGVCQTKPEGFEKRVFQIDANLGYPAAILEMLVYSSLGKIVLLPGIPDIMEEGEIKGVLCRGNILLDMKWSKNNISINLLSRRDQTISLEYNLQISTKKLEIDLKSNIVKELDLKLNNGK